MLLPLVCGKGLISPSLFEEECVVQSEKEVLFLFDQKKKNELEEKSTYKVRMLLSKLIMYISC